MRSELKAQYLRYTRDELLQIIHHPGDYTPEAVRAASAVLEEKYPDREGPDNMEGVPLADLLEDLDTEEDRYDPWAVRVFWAALVMMVVEVGFYALDAIRFIFFRHDGNSLSYRLGVSLGMYALPVAGVGVLAYFWYRRNRLAWMCFYMYILFGIVGAVDRLWVLTHLGRFVIWSGAGLWSFWWSITLIVLYCAIAWLAARDNFIGYFGVSAKTRRYTVIVSLLLMAFSLGNNMLQQLPTF